MPDLTLSDALEEAYASADPAAPVVDTISIYYNGLVDDDGLPSDLYMFNGQNPSLIDVYGARTWQARLEASAPRKAGQIVGLINIPFSITLPEMTTNPIPSASLSVDNIGREMSDLLQAAAQSGNAIEITYRAYILGSHLVGPENNPPIVFNLVDVQTDTVSASGRLITLTVGSRRFPYELYTPNRFRTLQYG